MREGILCCSCVCVSGADDRECGSRLWQSRVGERERSCVVSSKTHNKSQEKYNFFLSADRNERKRLLLLYRAKEE